MGQHRDDVGHVEHMITRSVESPVGLLERDDQLVSLQRTWAEARGGEGRLVFLGAEAGAGKTSLVAALTGTLRGGGRVLIGTCDAASTPAPLGPLFDVADSLSISGRLDDPSPRRAALFGAVRGSLGRTPTLFVIEDLHWADQATLDLVGYLGRRLAGQPTMIIASYRDDELIDSHPLAAVLGDLATAPGTSRMALPPLSTNAIATLARNRNHSIDVAALQRATGGNAFFVTEVLGSGGDRLPPTVRDAVLARAARLSSSARAVLDAAAVIGTSMPISLLLRVSQQTSTAVDECVGRGTLIERPPDRAGGGRELADIEPAVSFRHELARDAVRSRLLPGARVDLHRRVLQQLTTAARSDHRLIVEHAAACGDDAAILAHAPPAAEQAARLGSHRQAAELLRIALRHAEITSPAQRAELLERLSYQCYLTDQMPEAIEAQRASMALHRQAGNQAAVGEAQRWLSRLSWFLGHRDDTERYAAAAVATLEPLGPTARLAMAYSNRSQVAMLGGDSAASLAWGRRALDLARSIGDRPTEAHALNNIGTSLVQQGDVTEGLARLSQSLDLAVSNNLEEHAARSWTNLGDMLLSLRRFSDSEHALRTGIAYCRDRDLDSWALYMAGHLATALLEQGHSEAALDEATQLLGTRGVSTVSRIAAMIVGATAAVRSGSANAAALVQDAWSLALSSGEVQRTLPAALLRAEAAWTLDHTSRIPELTEEIWDTAQQRGKPWLIAELAWWRALGGAHDELLAHPPEPFALMTEGRSRAAGDAWAALGRPFWSALALAGGGPSETAEAMTLLHRLDATASAQAVRRDLARQGRPVPRGPRTAARTNPAGLTARELEVLALITDGCSDAEIARRLVVSERTASHHVSAVLHKLGVPSRTRAAAVGRDLLAAPPAAVAPDRSPSG